MFKNYDLLVKKITVFYLFKHSQEKGAADPHLNAENIPPFAETDDDPNNSQKTVQSAHRSVKLYHLNHFK